MIGDDILVVIPARGGSKGIPGKNVKMLAGKPLIWYSLKLAQELVDRKHICLSSDDPGIINIVKEFHQPVYFTRPDHLATDNASSQDVLIHALDYFKSIGRTYNKVLLLQPTSPFRRKEEVLEGIKLYSSDFDGVVSVNRVKGNPLASIFTITKDGCLTRLFAGDISDPRRQAGSYYEINGAFYLFNSEKLRTHKISDMKRLKMIEFDEVSSVDIDTPLDWQWCEFLLANDIQISKS